MPIASDLLLDLVLLIRDRKWIHDVQLGRPSRFSRSPRESVSETAKRPLRSRHTLSSLTVGVDGLVTFSLSVESAIMPSSYPTSKDILRYYATPRRVHFHATRQPASGVKSIIHTRVLPIK
jgi:hypothetical protein